ncbi:MAG: DegV family EDD domain-containing protein [Woeseia sp.]|nr:DegV family EDD domain-containing protein [Woeseia sp.]MBT8095804.1 DegV family EDD domain-containing protein [Woeseia sp.]NNE61746.1 DegV family EDD domain-containing protein [Woeseia sp.]NNL54159.1 DegV family EDD domain-containing protein [Woeseia sp.]
MSVESVSLQHLNTDKFAQALRSGIHRVIGEQETLNSINVFPVADGDTGTNLSLSLGAALGTLQASRGKRLNSLLAALADTLLDSARGNSGAIVAQFFQGVSDAGEQLSRFSTHTFTQAVVQGHEYARDALSDPREGTILSVIGAFAGSLQQQTVVNDVIGFSNLLTNAVTDCREALAKTQTQLEELRKAGVVDAGAKGFLALIEGVRDYIAEGRATPMPRHVNLDDAVTEMPVSSDADPRFRFCTECIVSGISIDRRKLRESLTELGDSLVLAGTKRKAKIHIHVNDPEEVFNVARRYGTLSGEKADDMLRQQHSSHETASRFAVITDSAADIDDTDLERFDIHMVPLRVQFGDRGFLDKVSISAGEFFKELQTNPVHPTTSQPSPGDFRRQFQFLASHFKDVLSINVSGRVSGTLQAAQSAAERVDANGKVHVVNSLNASIGQGLIVVYAAECAAAGLDIKTTLQAIDEIVSRTYTFGLVKDLRYGVRGGRVPAARKVLADLLRLTPVLRTEPDGRVSAGGVLFGRNNLLPRFLRYIASRVDRQKNWRASIGHAMCPEDAATFEKMLRARLPTISRCTITELGSALGAHSGPGAIVVALQEYRSPEEFRAST